MGKQNQWIAISEDEELANLLVNGRLTPVAGTGHLLQEKAPESMTTTIYS